MLILNGNVFFNGRFENKDIRIDDGRVAELAEPGRFGGLEQDAMKRSEVLDATGKYILPGLVDVHTHGRSGEDFSRVTKAGLQNLLASYKACGVTSVVGTTMTNEPAAVEKSLKVLGAHEETSSGARLLGVHMEGPFLGAEKKGAHDAKYLQHPDWARMEKMQELSGGSIRLVTIDPCLDGADGFIEACVKNGITVSLGHTACDYETAVKAGQAGANHVTHLFNAMNPLHHREPGLIGAAMDNGMYMELICDGIHVHPAVVRMLFAAYPERIVLVSDSIPAAGMPEGKYESGGMQVTVKNGKAVLADGTIAGSTVSLFDAMVTAIKFGVPAEQAVNSATYLPAKSVGMENVTGTIAEGRMAELLIVDKEWKLEKVFLATE